MAKGTGTKLLAALGALAVVLAACGPAAIATPTVASATAVPTRAAATATSQRPPPGGGATPQPTPSPAPTAVAAAGPKYGGTLRQRFLRDFDSWDPGKQWATIGEWLMWAYPRLFTYYVGKPGEPHCQPYPIQPELATGFKWVDDTTLDVSIRPGVKLPQKPPLNGREITAEDVVFTFNRIFFAQRLSPMQPMAASTDSVTAVDKSTVRFKLKSPHAEYPQVALAFFDTPILPPETLSIPGDAAKGEYSFESHQLGAYGRFRPKWFGPGVGLDLERNPDFFIKGRPYLDSVSLRIITEESTFMAAMRGGRLDGGLTRSSDTIADLAKLGDIPYVACPTSQAAPAFMNLGRPEFQDVNVRRAISMAIDREALNKLVWHNLAKGAYSVGTPALGRQWYMEPEDYPPQVRRWLTYDVKAARELMAKSPNPNGFTTKILFWPLQPGMGQTAETLSAMLKEIGITLRLESLSSTEYTIVIAQYPWDKSDSRHSGLLIGLASWTAVDDIYQYAYSTSARNRSVIKDPKVDQLIEEQRRTLDETKRQKIIRDLQTYMVDQMYMVPLPIGPHAEVYRPYVKGFYFKTYGYYDGETMRDAWLDR